MLHFRRLAQVPLIRETPKVIVQRRNISFLKRLLALETPEEYEEPPFYNWDDSPHEELRTRAALIRTKALCPVTKKPVNFVCPYSGIPTHHSEEAWKSDEEYHSKKTYELLRKVNSYEHDLRSGRKFPEFQFPGEQAQDFMTNFTSWDTYFYTRDFYPMNTEFNLAAASKILTYPITMAAILHRFSPYAFEPKGPVTLEGLRSLSALRYTLYPPYAKGRESENAFKERPMRIFIVGAMMESMLPGFVWKQFGYLFPSTKFEIHLIGPESYFDNTNRVFSSPEQQHGRPLVENYDHQISIFHHGKFFHEIYDTGDLFPFDPYLDVFFLFHPGFSTADSVHWNKTLKGLLESKCAVYVSGYHEVDMKREYDWLMNHELKDEIDILMKPGANRFGCTKLDLVDINPTEIYQANSDIMGFRGKRYHAIKA